MNDVRNSNQRTIKNSCNKIYSENTTNTWKNNSNNLLNDIKVKNDKQYIFNVYKTTNPKLNNFELCRNKSEKILNNALQKYNKDKEIKNSKNIRKRTAFQKKVSEKHLLKASSKKDLIKDYFLNFKYHSIENIKKLTTPIAKINIDTLKREVSLKPITISDEIRNSLLKETPKNFKTNPQSRRNLKNLQFGNTLDYRSLSKASK